MSQRFRCTGCGKLYPFNEKLVGKKVKCKGCNTIFLARVPPTSPSSDAPPGVLPALDSTTRVNSVEDLLDESLPRLESAIEQSAPRNSPLSPLSPRSGTGTAMLRSAKSTKMTKTDSKFFYYGIGLFIGGLLAMFGIELRSRGRRIRDRLSGASPTPVDPTFQFIGLLMAVAGVGAVCFALRRKLHVALPVGAGMLMLLGVSYLYSPMHRSHAAAQARFAAPSSPSSPAAAPPPPVVPRIEADPQPKRPDAPPVSAGNPPLTDPAAMVDLLQRVELPRDAVAGEWTMNQSSLESTGGRSILSFPVKPSRDYRWTIVLERLQGMGGINLVITFDDRQTMVVLEGFGQKKASGLNMLAGRTADVNETSRQGAIFTTGTPTTVVCTVRGSTIHVACDGREIISWSGSAADLSLDRRYWANVPAERLAVTIYDSNVLWRVSESRLGLIESASFLSNQAVSVLCVLPSAMLI